MRAYFTVKQCIMCTFSIAKYLSKKCIKGGRITEKRPILPRFFAL